MRLFTFGLFLALASRVHTQSRIETESDQAIQACLEACDPNHVSCQANCIPVDPSRNSAADATTECITRCDQGDGSEEAMLQVLSCVQACIAENAFRGSGTSDDSTTAPLNDETTSTSESTIPLASTTNEPAPTNSGSGNNNTGSDSSSGGINTLAIALGVGLGVGLPLTIGIIAFIWFKVWKTKRQEKASQGGAGEAGGQEIAEAAGSNDKKPWFVPVAATELPSEDGISELSSETLVSGETIVSSGTLVSRYQSSVRRD